MNKCAVFEALADGVSIRETAREVGVSKRTVSSYRRFWLEAAGEIDPCACGQASGHRGWCSVRFARSPRRQAVLAAMHERQARGLRAAQSGRSNDKRQVKQVPQELSRQEGVALGDVARQDILDLGYLPSPAPPWKGFAIMYTDSGADFVDYFSE